MPPRDPLSILDTHDVTNQPPVLADYNLYDSDPVLRAAVAREGAGWAEERLQRLGATLGSEQVIELGHAANRYPPELRAFDPFGRRIDEVTFHPAYHALMAMAMEHGVHSIAWSASETGGHVAHTALEYLLVQVEAGVCCPLTMTYAAVPVLRRHAGLAALWEQRLLEGQYFDIGNHETLAAARAAYEDGV